MLNVLRAESESSEPILTIVPSPDLGLEEAAQTGNLNAFAASARIANQDNLITESSKRAAILLLFKMKIMAQIAIRAGNGTRLKSPLVLETKNLHLIEENPRTEDGVLATHVANMFAAAIYAHFRSPESITRSNFFSEVTHVLWQAQEPIRNLADKTLREIIITWLDSPYTETVEKKTSVSDELSPQALRLLIKRWKRQEPGTYPS